MRHRKINIIVKKQHINNMKYKVVRNDIVSQKMIGYEQENGLFGTNALYNKD
jgi:hypothetical protein